MNGTADIFTCMKHFILQSGFRAESMEPLIHGTVSKEDTQSDSVIVHVCISVAFL